MPDFEVTFNLQQPTAEATFEAETSEIEAAFSLEDQEITATFFLNESGSSVIYTFSDGLEETNNVVKLKKATTTQFGGVIVGSNLNVDNNATISVRTTATPLQGSTVPITAGGTHSALGSKQDTLVSGTNIKTINNNSILGSGNLEIQTTTNWGNITGNIEDQADLQGALAQKQPVGDYATNTALTQGLAQKQDTLTAGDNVTISSNIISAKDTTYTAGTDIAITDNVISFTGTIPTVNDATLTIQRNSVDVDTFTANSATNKTVNIAVPTTSSEISYTNPEYPTVQAALDKLLYVTPTVTISGGGNYEVGQTINNVNLTWVWNKTITSQSLNQGIGSLEPSLRSYTYNTPTTTNKTFTITGSDGTTTKSASTAVSFFYKRYWGVSTNTTLTDSEILALSQELSSNRAQTRTFNCSGGKYFYFVILTSYCSGISFKVGGLSFSDMNVVTRNVVNASGATAFYNIYRPNNIQTGAAISVQVL